MRPGAAGRGRSRRLACLLLLAAVAARCASRRAASFAPATPDGAALARRAWEDSAARARAGEDANLLYDAAISRGPFRASGTLAVRLRGTSVEGTLSGAFGAPLATYADGELRGDKVAPVRLPPEQLRAVLAGTWIEAPSGVAGENGSEVLLRWSGTEPAEGVFDVGRAELQVLRVRRPEGELEARFSGARNPWPDRIEIEEKRTGNTLRLKLLSREVVP